MFLQTNDFERACKAYFRFCERNGFRYNQPSEADSSIVGESVKLANINGPLASFNLRSSKLYANK